METCKDMWRPEDMCRQLLDNCRDVETVGDRWRQGETGGDRRRQEETGGDRWRQMGTGGNWWRQMDKVDVSVNLN